MCEQGADFNCRRISENVSPAGVTSPFVARAMAMGGGASKVY
jgi:hypothetical protein